MIKIKRIDHVAIAVDNIDHALVKWQQALGLEPGVRELVSSQKTEVVLVPVGESNIELIEPKGNEGLQKFLEKRGPGLHHIAVEVEGIEAALELLKSLHVPLIDETPRIGARGHKVAFVHPRATGGVLVELVEPEPSH
ncbi:methylmalonyl-CoA epimerase [Polyangium sp. y55x31]|uniref:methylmalonyl-CoA epimerase n=1 Tax=Polyangium sp. y55x31 TaxID=3042688 RepID=UPI00248223E5|nr:methylmalonyl-CoA epimerase [Polyangium sp. y55x31]MDI1476961.1 methylmalonyl-CoA epimerase [Polyangium sp. y55x31]